MARFITCLLSLVLVLAMAGDVQARSKQSQPQGRTGVFDYYVLTLSWSPTFCLANPHNEQCDGKGYGFVLHGLWPQYANGGWPKNCESDTRLSASDRAKGKSLFPTEGLLRHEWATHGTCSGLGATGYLDAADKALGRVKVPAIFEPSQEPHYLQASEIAELFRQSNPGMPNDGVAVSCRGPELAEVRVCLTKDLLPIACGKGVRSNCRSGQIRVPGVR